jgi:hypothetical protein
LEFDFEAGRNPVSEFFTQHPGLLKEPSRREKLEAERVFQCSKSVTNEPYTSYAFPYVLYIKFFMFLAE